VVARFEEERSVTQSDSPVNGAALDREGLRWMKRTVVGMLKTSFVDWQRLRWQYLTTPVASNLWTFQSFKRKKYSWAAGKAFGNTGNPSDGLLGKIRRLFRLELRD
jgi:hypothetical protein